MFRFPLKIEQLLIKVLPRGPGLSLASISSLLSKLTFLDLRFKFPTSFRQTHTHTHTRVYLCIHNYDWVSDAFGKYALKMGLSKLGHVCERHQTKWKGCCPWATKLRMRIPNLLLVTFKVFKGTWPTDRQTAWLAYCDIEFKPCWQIDVSLSTILF